MKIQCPYIEKGENVHTHYCNCCNGKQHIASIKVLKYQLRGLLVLSRDGKGDASDAEMHDRIENYIEHFKRKYNCKDNFIFSKIYHNEPIHTLNSCIDTLNYC